MKKTLAVILAVALVLFGTAFCLQGVAQERAAQEHLWLMETLLPGGTDFVRVPCEADDIVRSVHRCDAGYVIETTTYGYAGEITMVIGLTHQGKVTGLVTLDAHETLGLGSRILTDHVFLSQFLNKSGSFTIETGGTDAFTGATAQAAPGDTEVTVDGISGATVSSKAVARCVSAAVAYVTGVDVVTSATQWGG